MTAEPTGRMVDDVYLHESPSGNKTRAVVLLTDIFGLPLVNSKLVADEISNKLDCDVWVPDLFNGKPLFGVDELTPLVPTKPGTKVPIWSILKVFTILLPRVFRMFSIRASVTDYKVDAVGRPYMVHLCGINHDTSSSVKLGTTKDISKSVP